jgi:hypothetical protein
LSAADYNQDIMADLATPSPRRETALIKRRREDVFIAAMALIGAMLALPLAPSSWHGPEVAAVLAVAATAMLAGQRWAIAVVVLAELLLLPTAWPRAFFAQSDEVVRLAAMGTIVTMVPGLLAMRRAAAAMVLVTGWKRTSRVCRRFHAALIGIGVIVATLPIL